MVTQNVLVNTKCWLLIGTHHSWLWWLRLLKRCLHFFYHPKRSMCTNVHIFKVFSGKFSKSPNPASQTFPKMLSHDKSREKNLATMTLFKFSMFIFGLNHLYCLFYKYKWSEFKFYFILLGLGTWGILRCLIIMKKKMLKS